MGVNLKKIIESGWTNFRRNSYLSFAATGIMALALILFLGLLSLQFLTSQVVSSLQEKIDISAYFKTDATEEQMLKIKSDLSVLPEVVNVIYTSRDQALSDFKARHIEDDLIQESLEQLDSNPLAASLNIKTRDSSQYASIAQFLENNSLRSVIDKINFYENKGVIERVENISGGIKGWGLVITLVLAFIAILVTFNTVRLTIFNQKQEIEIMRLVGASNWHIRGPYLAEGGLYGLFASVIALSIFYPSVYFVSDKITAFAPTVNIFGYFLVGVPQVVLMVTALGVLLGVASSYIAIRKHLKI
ncbi:MAG: FtsX-like permease family protein [Candidatus Yanofskybacteria bacterium]|nr:FtsX-like permease family protein [Candidatus Yanofskybacteria bacterium]